MTTITHLPKDIIRLVLTKYLHPIDAIHCIKASKKVFKNACTKREMKIIEKRIYFFKSYELYHTELEKRASFLNKNKDPVGYCNYCNTVIKHKNMERHLNKCHSNHEDRLLNRISCKQCSFPLLKTQYDKHLRFCCPKRIMKCRNSNHMRYYDEEHIEKCNYENTFLRVLHHQKTCFVLCWKCGERFKFSKRYLHLDPHPPPPQTSTFQWIWNGFFSQPDSIMPWSWFYTMWT